MNTDILGTIFGVLSETLRIYSLLLLVRVLLTWFPNLDWSNPILSNISAISDPYLKSKLDKARDLGIKVLNESEFMKLINN